MDTIYPGNNINDPTPTSSYQDCRTLCEDTLGCKAFSWSSGGAQAGCWLKSKISGISRLAGSVSGKACKISKYQPIMPQTFIWSFLQISETCLPEKGVDYAGNDINPDSGAMWDKVGKQTKTILISMLTISLERNPRGVQSSLWGDVWLQLLHLETKPRMLAKVKEKYLT